MKGPLRVGSINQSIHAQTGSHINQADVEDDNDTFGDDGKQDGKQPKAKPGNGKQPKAAIGPAGRGVVKKIARRERRVAKKAPKR